MNTGQKIIVLQECEKVISEPYGGKKEKKRKERINPSGNLSETRVGNSEVSIIPPN